MKQKHVQPFLVIAFVFAFLVNACDIYNMVIDEWWVGNTGVFVIPKKRFTVKFTMTEKANGEEYFDAVGGNKTTIPDQIVSEGETSVSEPGLVVIDKDTPNDGHHDTPATKYFEGWYTDPVGGTKWEFDKTVVTADKADTNGVINLYSRWSGSGNTVTFAPGGDFDKSGTIVTTNGEIDFTKTVYPPEPEFVTSGTALSWPKGFGLTSGNVSNPANPADPFYAYNKYSFTGWYIDKNNNQIVDIGDEKWDFTRAVTSDMTLYAGWGEKTGGGVIQPEKGGAPVPAYTVNFEGNGAEDAKGEPPLPETVVQGGKITSPEAIFKPGYSFIGWYKDRACTIPWDFNTETVDEADDRYAKGADDNTFTLYANWDPVPYTEEWFNKYYVRATPNNVLYFPFQLNSGGYDYSNWDQTDDGDPNDPNDEENPVLDTNMTNEDRVIQLLRDHPTWVARVTGYKDNATDNHDTEREAATWSQLTTETGVERSQVILNTALPSGTSPDSPEMIIGPNPSAGTAADEGDDDEIRIIVYIPM